jgi:hypothetical protein
MLFEEGILLMQDRQDDHAISLPSGIRDGAIVPREYQTKVASAALKSNTPVVLPTAV